MPIQYDTPVGIGAWDEWALWGAAPDKISAVATSDGDTSVIYAHSTGRVRIQLYTFSPILAVADPVNAASLTFVARYYQTGNSTGRYLHVQWGTTIDTPYGSNYAQTVMDAGGAYTTIAFSAAGAELALSRVNSHHGLYYGNNGGTGWECWVTYLFRTVDYGPAAADTADTEFAHIIGSLAAVIGGNLLLRDMPRLNRMLRRVKFRPDEYERAWRAWRNAKNPVSVS